eukprot:CAMPEP_0182910534 /NCGR_PEP_ID=MMETSP0034_2-20130328/36380_1 /TAXON_ID=156128 /ORGANISM="Nephroselmis pyriformis, Strain CCMP717" /LENGTH=198 /DNA_ID=CAMNT_0025046909 /DNA_START=84 /DNA_END=679 /DNA_ORIENTATION=+
MTHQLSSPSPEVVSSSSVSPPEDGFITSSEADAVAGAPRESQGSPSQTHSGSAGGRLEPPEAIRHLGQVELHIQFVCEYPLHIPRLQRPEALSEATPLVEIHGAPTGRVGSPHVIVEADVSAGEVAQRSDGLEIRGGEVRGDDTRENGEDDERCDQPQHAHQPPPPGAQDLVTVADGPPETVVDAVEVLAGEVAGVRF